jgi:hypothetical protein
MGQVQTPTVVGLFTAPGAGEPMQRHASVIVAVGIGIPDDRYAKRTGHWSDPRWPDQELTFVEAELLRELQLPLESLRRNVVTRGIDLEDLIGSEFSIGSARLRGVRRCTPCGYIERLTRPDLLRQLADRGGLRAEVIEAGEFEIGDEIRVCGREQR